MSLVLCSLDNATLYTRDTQFYIGKTSNIQSAAILVWISTRSHEHYKTIQPLHTAVRQSHLPASIPLSISPSFFSFLFFFSHSSPVSSSLLLSSSLDIIGRVFLDRLLFALSFFCFCSSIFLLSELPALARALPCAVNNLHDSPIILLSNDRLIGLQKRRDNTLNNAPIIIPSSSSYPALSVSCARVV